jgi:pilus assembly protein CpaB
LADKDVAGLPALIPPGMRALSVRVNDVIAVAGFVLPGTRVDVLLTGNPGSGGDSVTTTVLENVAVLATGQKLERNAAGEPQNTAVITLLVSPEDAQKLTLASQEGRIQLSLRNPLDTGQEKIASLRNAALYSGATPPPVTAPPRTPTKVKHVAPSAAPPRPVPYTIEIIRGNEKKEVNFEP